MATPEDDFQNRLQQALVEIIKEGCKEKSSILSEKREQLQELLSREQFQLLFDQSTNTKRDEIIWDAPLLFPFLFFLFKSYKQKEKQDVMQLLCDILCAAHNSIECEELSRFLTNLPHILQQLSISVNIEFPSLPEIEGRRHSSSRTENLDMCKCTADGTKENIEDLKKQLDEMNKLYGELKKQNIELLQKKDETPSGPMQTVKEVVKAGIEGISSFPRLFKKADNKSNTGHEVQEIYLYIYSSVSDHIHAISKQLNKCNLRTEHINNAAFVKQDTNKVIVVARFETGRVEDDITGCMEELLDEDITRTILLLIQDDKSTANSEHKVSTENPQNIPYSDKADKKYTDLAAIIRVKGVHNINKAVDNIKTAVIEVSEQISQRHSIN